MKIKSNNGVKWKWNNNNNEIKWRNNINEEENM